MKKTSFHFLIGIVFFIALTSAIVFWYPRCTLLSCIQIPGSGLWREKEVYEHTNTRYRALLSAKNYTVRIEKNSGLSPGDAKFLTNVATMQATGMFDDARSPYPGVISDRIHCDTTYKPEVKHIKNGNLDITYYATWLNDRLQYGACLESDLPYRSYHATFYCAGEHALYHLEFIAKRGETTDDTYLALIHNITCQPPIFALP